MLCCAFTTSKAQTNPQIEFNSEYDLSFLEKPAKNDVEDYDNAYFRIRLSQIFDMADEKKNLELYYKMYTIQHTSELHYRMKDDGKLYFYCTDPDEEAEDYVSFMLGDDVDFGTPLVKVEQTKEGVNRMRFESKVTQIDPAIFQDGVTEVKLPFNEGMHYQSSKTISVHDLIAIKGKDVIDNTLLVDKNKTLIAGAFASKESYEFPDGVEAIGEGAMRRNTLASVTFPATLRSVGEYALADCVNLNTVSFTSSEMVQISENAFGDAFPATVELKVPKKLLKQYKKAYPMFKKQFKAL